MILNGVAAIILSYYNECVRLQSQLRQTGWN